MTTFLATTALDEFWDDQSSDVLFLGSWCFRQHRRERWERLPHRILPSPWNDRERFAAAASYVDRFAERLLPLIGERLNIVHGERRSGRYWRVLLGPWLLHSVHAAYDRYEHLRDAAALGRFETWGLDASSWRVPATSMGHLALLSDDHYNLQLFTQLLEAMGHEVRKKELEPKQPSRSSVRVLQRAKRGAAAGFEAILRRGVAATSRSGAILLQDMYADRGTRMSLAWRSAGKIVPVESMDRRGAATAVFNDARRGLSRLNAENDFERAFAGMLPHLLPVTYLERYRELSAAYAPPSRASVFASANGLYLEPTQFAAAQSIERGAKLVGVQHGGGYGVFRHAPVETHEKRATDRFLVWGWAAQDAEKLRNVPAPKLSAVARRRTKRAASRSTDILFLGTSHPRYLYRFHSAPVGTQWDEYFDWQGRFLRGLSDRTRAHVLYRGYPHDYGQDVVQRVPLLSTVRRKTGGAGTTALLESRLAVIDHCSTGYLEALALNVPSILFWNRERWEIRKEAQPFFDALSAAGILFFDPDEAAKQLERVYEDVDKWWSASDVQNARRSFTHNFALTDEKWESTWAGVLAKEASRLSGAPSGERHGVPT